MHIEHRTVNYIASLYMKLFACTFYATQTIAVVYVTLRGIEQNYLANQQDT